MSERRSLIPPAAVTGVGSLPHTDAEAAVELVAAACPELPFWPQLPRRAPEEGLLRQFLGDAFTKLDLRRDGAGYRIRDRAVSSFLAALDRVPELPAPKHAAGLAAFLAALDAGRFAGAATIKGQITGPVTLSRLLHSGDASLAGDPEAVRRIAGIVARGARAQAGALGRAGHPVLIVVDEPGFALNGTGTGDTTGVRDAIGIVIASIHDAGAAAGIHCCATPPLGVLVDTGPDVISFDAHRSLDLFFDSPEVRTWMECGGRPSFGLVPTGQAFAGFDAATAARRIEAAAGSRGIASTVFARSLWTAACGLALEPVAAAEASLAAARAVAAAWR